MKLINDFCVDLYQHATEALEVRYLWAHNLRRSEELIWLSSRHLIRIMSFQRALTTLGPK